MLDERDRPRGERDGGANRRTIASRDVTGGGARDGEADRELIVAKPFDVEAISRRLVCIADPWGNLIELSEVLV